MKQLFKFIILFIILALILVFRQEITSFIIDKFIYTKQVYIEEANEYALDYEFEYVQTTDDFKAKNYHQLLNILFTALNGGNEYFYFFCDYDECEKDVDTLTESNHFVNINNYVHPYNSYRKLYVSVNALGKVSITVGQAYDNDDITAVNKKIDDIIDDIIEEDMTEKEKIIAFHDYVINNTKYDTEYIEKGIDDLDNTVHTAVGTLLYHRALCGGYADTMSVFLNKLNIPNYRISSENHIWNYVYLDNAWYHLDLTWDDPVTENGDNLLKTTFLLITTEELEDLETGYHDYDKTVYLEAN